MVRVVLLIACLILSNGSVLAGGPMSGCVLSRDGAPVEGAEVALYNLESNREAKDRFLAGEDRQPLAEAVSGQDGTFSLELALMPDQEISVRADGFAPALVQADGGIVGAVLRQADQVRGRVRDGDGRAVSGALVVASTKQGRVVFHAWTADDGSYDLPEPEHWLAELVVVHPEQGVYRVPGEAYSHFSSESSADVSALPNVQYRDFIEVAVTVADEAGESVAEAAVRVNGWLLTSTDADGRAVLRAMEGQVVEVALPGLVARAEVDGGRVDLILEAARTLHGRVTEEESGQGVAFARLAVADRSWQAGRRAVLADAQGRYSMTGLAALEYHVMADVPGLVGNGAVEEVDLRRTMTVEQNIELKRRSQIKGSVVRVDGSPVAGALVAALTGHTPVMLGLPSQGVGTTTLTDCEGRFAIPAPEHGWPLSLMAVLGGLPVGTAARITEDQVSKSVLITIPEAVMVTGAVSGPAGEPVAGATIAGLLGERSSRGLKAVQLFGSLVGIEWIYETDAGGNFELPLSEGIWELAFSQKGYRAALSGPLQVTSGLLPVSITLEHSSFMRGRVEHEAGSPVVGAELRIRGEDVEVPATTSDESGRFEVSDLEPGSYVVFAQDPITESRVSTSVRVPGPGVTLVLPTTYAVTGRVLDKVSGEPVDEARIRADSAGWRADWMTAGSSASDGSFELKGMAPGRYVIKAEAKGFLSFEGPELDVGSGQVSRNLEFDLERGLSVSGRVVDEDGQPVFEAYLSMSGTGTYRNSAYARADEDGRFEVTGLPVGSVTLSGFHEDFVSIELELELENDRDDIELVLERGLSVVGRVVDATGQPIRDARVRASASGVPGGGNARAVTDKDGKFELKAMPEAEWELTAAHPDWASTTEKAVNPSLRPHVTLVLEAKKTGTVVGTVSGMDSDAMVWVVVRSEESSDTGDSAYSAVEADGTFTIDDAPVGTNRVIAQESGPRHQRSRSKVVEVSVGAEVTVDLDLDEGATVTGRITRAGEAVFGAAVMFQGRELMSTSTTTDTDGYYEVAVQEGSYTVRVAAQVRRGGPGRQLDVDGATVFDFDIAGAVLVGRVVDAVSGDPVAAADVDVEVDGGGQGYYGGGSVVTDSIGHFRLEELGAGPHVVRVEHQDYGQWRRSVTLNEGQQLELEAALEKHDGLLVVLKDARSGQSLSGTVVARDLAGVVVFDGHPQPEGDGVRLPVAPGRYKVSASATGYATATVETSAPGGDVTIALTPGGTLVVRSADVLARLARLILPSGEEYVRCWCNRIAELRLVGTMSEFKNIAAGSYNLVVNERDGDTSSYPVTVIEGQMVEVLIE